MINKISEFYLNVDSPLFEGLCGGVEPSVLYATIKHLKHKCDKSQSEIERLLSHISELEDRIQHAVQCLTCHQGVLHSKMN